MTLHPRSYQFANMHVLVLWTALLAVFVHCNEQCEIEESGVDDKAKEEIVRKHNELRAKVANGEQEGFPQASNMLELVWDDEVAEKAQEWANKCIYEHDEHSDRDTGRGATGQNIANEEKPGEDPDWDKMIQMFYDEVSLFDPSGVDNFHFTMETGHFTQIVWADTNKIGCGYTRHKKGQNHYHLYGCNYLPAGNFADQPLYKKGEPCSECGGCGDIPGLCKSESGGESE